MSSTTPPPPQVAPPTSRPPPRPDSQKSENRGSGSALAVDKNVESIIQEEKERQAESLADHAKAALIALGYNDLFVTSSSSSSSSKQLDGIKEKQQAASVQHDMMADLNSLLSNMGESSDTNNNNNNNNNNSHAKDKRSSKAVGAGVLTSLNMDLSLIGLTNDDVDVATTQELEKQQQQQQQQQEQQNQQQQQQYQANEDCDAALASVLNSLDKFESKSKRKKNEDVSLAAELMELETQVAKPFIGELMLKTDSKSRRVREVSIAKFEKDKQEKSQSLLIDMLKNLGEGVKMTGTKTLLIPKEVEDTNFLKQSSIIHYILGKPSEKMTYLLDKLPSAFDVACVSMDAIIEEEISTQSEIGNIIKGYENDAVPIPNNLIITLLKKKLISIINAKYSTAVHNNLNDSSNIGNGSSSSNSNNNNNNNNNNEEQLHRHVTPPQKQKVNFFISGFLKHLEQCEAFGPCHFVLYLNSIESSSDNSKAKQEIVLNDSQAIIDHFRQEKKLIEIEVFDEEGEGDKDKVKDKDGGKFAAFSKVYDILINEKFRPIIDNNSKLMQEIEIGKKLKPVVAVGEKEENNIFKYPPIPLDAAPILVKFHVLNDEEEFQSAKIFTEKQIRDIIFSNAEKERMKIAANLIASPQTSEQAVAPPSFYDPSPQTEGDNSNFYYDEDEEKEKKKNKNKSKNKNSRKHGSCIIS